MRATVERGAVTLRRRGELLRIEAWGRDSLRVRATVAPSLPDRDWALSQGVPAVPHGDVRVEELPDGGWSVTNGRVRCTANGAAVLSFFRDGEPLLREYHRDYDGTISRESRCLRVDGRTWRPYVAGAWRLEQRFEARPGERIFGMGQYQQPQVDLKGCVLDLEQRNSQASVPFYVSSLGYGFLWNNPAVGRVAFGSNQTVWRAEATEALDYWVTVGDDPRELVEKYTAVTGRAPSMPDDLLGLWQSKLRYRTQDEVLSVARSYRERGIPLDVIVIDFFHWPHQGDWRFDERYWPDPKAMVDELHAMGVRVCVSVWPTVDKRSENFARMLEDGLLVRTERGGMQAYDFAGDCLVLDATNPAARDFVWDACQRNYADLGVDMFWLDNSEPELAAYDFDHYRYRLGPALSCSNAYPQLYARAFHDHQVAEGDPHPVSLIRCAWAGSQRLGNVVWSGDVPSTFEALRDQLACGIGMGLAGIPWWTTDIGGFMTDDAGDPAFRQLLVRWFQFATFTPILRMHGYRGPYDVPALDDADWGGGFMYTGHGNELWSFGEEAFRIMRHYLDVRLGMRPYLHDLFAEASRDGSPLIRAMFYEFPDDPRCWETYDQYMFGPRYLVAPILTADTWEREVYLPAGTWRDTRTGERLDGGRTVLSPAPIESVPVLERVGE